MTRSKLPRCHLVAARLNDRELEALNRLIVTGSAKNISEWIRQAILSAALELDVIEPSPAEVVLTPDELRLCELLKRHPDDFRWAKMRAQQDNANPNTPSP